MEIDIEQTDVVFRVDTTKDWKGTVYALFPHEIANYSSGNVLTYQHVGQHSEGDYGYCVSTSRLAKPEEYNELHSELTQIGYNLNVIKKQNRKLFLKRYHNKS